MSPEHLYFAALAFVILPAMPFSIGAMLVGAVWVFGQALLYLGGLNDPLLDMTTNGMALSLLLAMLFLRWRWSNFVLALTFAYMIYINGLDASDALHPYYAWWYNYYAAMAQVAVIPFTVNWALVKEGVAALRDNSFLDNLLRVAAPWKA